MIIYCIICNTRSSTKLCQSCDKSLSKHLYDDCKSVVIKMIDDMMTCYICESTGNITVPCHGCHKIACLWCCKKCSDCHKIYCTKCIDYKYIDYNIVLKCGCKKID